MIEVGYESYWKLTEEEKERLSSDYGIVKTTATFDPVTRTLQSNPINAEDLDFNPATYIGSYAVYKDRYYPTFLKKYDSNEYVDIIVEDN